MQNQNTVTNIELPAADRNAPDKFARLKAMASGEVQAPALAADVQFWAHEPHQPLMGTIIGFDSFEHPSYGKQETVIVERDTGEVVSAILTNYLQNGMQMQNGSEGDLVFIEKLGQERSKNGKMFNKFKFIIDKQ
jgi:hypothetical protein